MRIIAGQYKGKKLAAGNDLTIRPITTKLKESVFNTLGDFITEKVVLDLFSGSGSFGLEALSRGAKRIIFVEQAPSSIKVLQENLNALSVPSDCFHIHFGDAHKFIHNNSTGYELILMDPPFNFSYLQDFLDIVISRKVLAKSGMLVLHHEVSNPIQESSMAYDIFKQRKFGRNLISYILRKDLDVE
jgi:16S rRNA (guanine966-N2)-methyltransferase